MKGDQQFARKWAWHSAAGRGVTSREMAMGNEHAQQSSDEGPSLLLAKCNSSWYRTKPQSACPRDLGFAAPDLTIAPWLSLLQSLGEEGGGMERSKMPVD